MIFLSSILVCLTSTRFLPVQHKVLDDASIQLMLQGIEFEERDSLIRFGRQVFPAYFRILQAKDTEWLHRVRIFGILSAVKGDRSQFVEIAVEHLTHSHAGVRQNAVRLLGEIGSTRDAAPVVALLSDQDWTVGIAAAKALALIGDQRTLQAMDVWISTSAPRKDRNEQFDRSFRNDIAGYRDELKQRLEKAQSVRKPLAPPPRAVVKP